MIDTKELYTYDTDLLLNYLLKKYLINEQVYLETVCEDLIDRTDPNTKKTFTGLNISLNTFDDSEFKIFNRENIFDSREISARFFDKDSELISWKVNTRGIRKSRWGSNRYFYVYRDAAYGKLRLANLHNLETCPSDFFPLFT